MGSNSRYTRRYNWGLVGVIITALVIGCIRQEVPTPPPPRYIYTYSSIPPQGCCVLAQQQDVLDTIVAGGRVYIDSTEGTNWWVYYFKKTDSIVP